jgi:Tol biopolymer transport system component
LRTGATTAVPDATGWMAVSPDRAHIVYQTNQPGGVAVAGPGAANPHPVTDPQTHVGYAWFTWAPDSSRVAYMARPAGGGGYDIFTAAADGSDVHQLTTGANVRYEVPDGPKMAWSPDGRTIAFISDQGNGSSVLEIVAVSTGAVTPVTPADGQYMTVVGWLPDGQTLLATTSSWRMVLVPVGGGAVRTVTTDNTLEANPALSPDGQWIAYERGSGGGPLVVVRTNGTGGHVLVSAGLGSYPGPSWSPDGRNILFTWDTNSGHAGGTSYVNATGGSTTAVHSGADIDAVW